MSEHANNIDEAGSRNHIHDRYEVVSEIKTGSSDSYKPTPHISLEENSLPLPVKKVADLNGMSLQMSCDESIARASESKAEDEELSSKENAEKENQTDKVLAESLDSLQLSSSDEDIEYVGYESELQMGAIMALITKDLSEPYSIYTYRYFIHNWPNLCFLAMYKDQCVGAIVCKLDVHKNMVHRGYIAMLAVEKEFRRHKIGTKLVKKAIKAMIADNCDEVVLETEITNKAALRLYEKLGFVRDKRLFRYYLNGVDALRLKLWLR